MALQVSTEQRIFITLEYTIKKGTELEDLKYLYLKIIPELKIANFLITILQFFCDSVIQSLYYNLTEII